MRTFFIVLILSAFSFTAFPQVNYNDYFTSKRLRFDFYIEGNFRYVSIKPDKIWEEKIWAGSKTNLIDTFQYGNYMIKIIDKKSGKLIYSKGYCDLFVEWQTIAGAKDSTARYHECLLFPAPKKKVILEIYKRDTALVFNKIYDRVIDPKSADVVKRKPLETKSKVINKSDNCSQSIDIVFLSEGYTSEQEEKFYSDAERFCNYLFAWQPYQKYRHKINITAVFYPSPDKGVDIPGQGIYANTIVDAHFYTFNLERYLTIPDLCKVYNYLSEYPVDQVCVLANCPKYGGGGIYNFYTIFTTANEKAEYLFLHEFGHGFAALGDEYFNSVVAYEEFGSMQHEPYEPNFTNLVDFHKKWADMVADTIPIPTPDLPEFDNVVGVFEGANYLTKGFYRPQRDCVMRSSEMKRFCKVCERSIEKMINFYSK